MPYKSPISVDEINSKLAYDPETGIFTWKVSPAKNIKSRTEAGCVKSSRKDVSYRYIRLGHEIPAARIAWVIHYGEWPKGKIFFSDQNTLNLRISNLRIGNCLPEKYESNAEYMKAHRGAFPKVWRETHLKRTFGITLADYSQMVSDRDNKCDICGQPEKQERAGKLKALAVDHDHKTGAVRGLLCSDCNTALGKFQDSKDLLTSAIAYLAKHMVS